jgi:hypothetical protein
MPTYCFKNKETGSTQDVFWTISEMESKCKGVIYKDGDGVVWERDFAAEHGDVAANCGNWPMKSDAAGVHPDQIGAARKEAKRFGVPTEFDTKTGQAIFSNRSHRAQYLKAKGYHDRNGGYGDG